MDDKKIINEGEYNISDIYNTIDNLFAECQLIKGQDGEYLEKGTKDDFAHFWSAILTLKNQNWFMDNIKEWLWFNSDDADNPEDFEIDDLAEHYKNKQKNKA
ncbi:MAG: hypothetical protein AB9836_03070 [Aminipila sp.]